MERATAPSRRRRVDEIAEALPERASALSRLFLAHSNTGLSRTSASVMRLLAQRPRRITELAACEGLTQPGVTLLVNRLEAHGWAERERDPSDARAVLVKLTAEGERVFESLRAEYRALLREETAALPDADVEALARAVEILDHLIDRLRERHTNA